MKLTKIKIFLIGFFILGIINIPFVSFAEQQIEIQEGEINISTSPNNPEPYQDVTITLSSYATDLTKAIMTWRSGSNTVLYGIGKTSYTFKTGGVGSSNVFTISITPPGSINTLIKKIAIYPSEIEIMWESIDGYTPPFYKGKSLPINGSLIKATAIPNTQTIQSGNGSISYIWSNLDSVVEGASGYNKNSYIFKNSMFDDINQISVKASSVAGNYSAEKSVEIPIYEPKIIFYQKSPAEGIFYNYALDKEYAMSEDELTLVAEPYFMPVDKKDDSISYKWKLNGNTIATPSKKTELTIRPTSRGGYANVDLYIENINELFQKVSNKLKLTL